MRSPSLSARRRQTHGRSSHNVSHASTSLFSAYGPAYFWRNRHIIVRSERRALARGPHKLRIGCRCKRQSVRSRDINTRQHLRHARAHTARQSKRQHRARQRDRSERSTDRHLHHIALRRHRRTGARVRRTARGRALPPRPSPPASRTRTAPSPATPRRAPSSAVSPPQTGTTFNDKQAALAFTIRCKTSRQHHLARVRHHHHELLDATRYSLRSSRSNASTTNATTTNLYITGLTNSGLGVDANGKVYAAATSTLATISGSLTRAVTGSLALSSIAQIAANTVLANAPAVAQHRPRSQRRHSSAPASAGQVLAWNAGVPQWVATTTLTNGAGITTTYSATNNQWTIANTGAPSPSRSQHSPLPPQRDLIHPTAASSSRHQRQPHPVPVRIIDRTFRRHALHRSDCRTTWPTSGGSGDPFPTHTSYAGQTTSATLDPLAHRYHRLSRARRRPHVRIIDRPHDLRHRLDIALLRQRPLKLHQQQRPDVDNGTFGCEPDDTSVGTANPFTWEENFAVTNAATSSILWAKLGLNASSTSHFATALFDIASSTSASSTFLTARTQWFTSLRKLRPRR